MQYYLNKEDSFEQMSGSVLQWGMASYCAIDYPFEEFSLFATDLSVKIFKALPIQNNT